jgi:hypothetical protein
MRKIVCAHRWRKWRWRFTYRILIPGNVSHQCLMRPVNQSNLTWLDLSKHSRRIFDAYLIALAKEQATSWVRLNENRYFCTWRNLLGFFSQALEVVMAQETGSCELLLGYGHYFCSVELSKEFGAVDLSRRSRNVLCLELASGLSYRDVWLGPRTFLEDSISRSTHTIHTGTVSTCSWCPYLTCWLWKTLNHIILTSKRTSA